MPACLDCKYLKRQQPARCTHPACEWPLHPFASSMIQQPTTEYARGSQGNCGVEGTLWEKAE